MNDVAPRVAWRGLLSGLVQGIGMRPAVARVALELHLTGYVENTAAGVVVWIEGSRESVASFIDRLRSSLPPGARIDSWEGEWVTPAGGESFEIRSATNSSAIAAALTTSVPVDRRVCERCLDDVFRGDDRRRNYPFTSCTDCGPRYSIVRRMPYERDSTSMAPFQKCERCSTEYANPEDRRFHAQTNACRDCGPRIEVTTTSTERREFPPADEQTLEAARECLQRGGIVALLSLGGFQFCVDATNEAAVRRLRDRKGRPAKPLAIAVENLAEAERWTMLDDHERAALTSPAGPIVLVRARPDKRLAHSVHPGLEELGVMLPTTPLHALLCRGLPPLVMTSGNRDGEPLAYRRDDSSIREVADMVVAHDREVERPIDDSVVRIMSGQVVTIRAARGLAPLDIELPFISYLANRRDAEFEPPTLLALGTHQKAAIAMARGGRATLGPYVGDLDTEATRVRYVDQLRRLLELYGRRPEVIVHDLHPDYFTTRFADSARTHFGDFVDGPRLRTFGVQHHHAHLAATMAEHRLLDRRVLGIAWDGTGWGPDGTIWGGEFLVTTATSFQRAARLRPFRLPGGESAIRSPWRTAFALVLDALGDVEAACAVLGGSPQLQLLVPLLRSGLASPWTSSVGRLFDAIAVLIEAIPVEDANASFEGEFAMHLESLCGGATDEPRDEPPYAFPLDESTGEVAEFDWRPLVREILTDRHRGVPAATMARRFHRALAETIVAMAERYPDLPIVAGGGVFQNRRLVEWLANHRKERGAPFYFPAQIPPNDGGISLGQLAVVSARLAQER